MRRFTLIAFSLLLLAASAAGQGRKVFDWAELSNPAVLSFLEDGALSHAGLSFRKDDGGLVSLEGSPDAWSAGAGAEAFHRVSGKLAFHGEIGYTYFRGRQMGGQILMDPASNPVNFLEEDFSTRGTKKRETYTLSGGAAYTLSPKVALGLAFDYTSADQVKYKDPRFKNVWMDMVIRPGVLLHLGERFSLGANLEYRHTLESLSAGNFGTVEQNYYILVDRGGFYGSREIFDGDAGYVSTSNTRPLSNSYYGLSLQALGGGFTAQLTALYRTGYYGSRTSTSVVFCEWNGPEAALKGSYKLVSGKNIHRFGMDASFSLLSNCTNSYKHDIRPGMSNVIVYTGQSKSFSRTQAGGVLSYRFEGGTDAYLPAWEAGAAAGGHFKLQDTRLYPFSRKWTSTVIDVQLSGGRNLQRGRNIYSCSLQTSFLTGFGQPRSDTMASGGQTTLRSFDSYSDRQFEYETATRAGAGVELKYTRIVSGRIIPYVTLSDTFCHLLSAPQYLDGAGRNVALITLGCQF